MPLKGWTTEPKNDFVNNSTYLNAGLIQAADWSDVILMIWMFKNCRKYFNSELIDRKWVH